MSSFGKRRRTSGDVDVEIDMVPVMNMFLVLIPFLLMSSSFLHLKVINTSVPVKSTEIAQKQPPKSDIKLTVIVAMADDTITLTATSEELTEDKLKAFDQSLSKKDSANYPFSEFTEALVQIKNQFPKSDTVIIMPDDNIKYDEIIKTMDAARQYQVVEKQIITNENNAEVGSALTKAMTPKVSILFPNVVLSAKAG